MADNKQNTGPEEQVVTEAAAQDIPAPEMTAEEAVILEQEGRAALFEMGEALPDQGDNLISYFMNAEQTGSDMDEKAAPPEKADKPKEEKAQPAPEETKVPEAAKPRRGRPSSVDKAAPAEAKPLGRDKMSQSKKAPVKSAPAKEEAPSADKPAPAKEEPSVPEQPPAPRDASRAEKEEIVYLNLSDLHAFKNHPFGVRDDEEMRALVDSVKTGGVNQPAIVRPREDGGYEIIAGHRRQKASELAGYANMPCIVRNMTDDEAILAMTDDNLRQRSSILPTEKAQSLKMQVEAIKHQGGRMDGVAAGDIGKRSTEMVGERNGMNYKQVQRYIRLNELVPDLMKLMDEKKLGFTTAVELSYISKKNQNYIAVAIDSQQSSPSQAQAKRMRELDEKKLLNGDVIDGIMMEDKKEVDKVILTGAELSKYFGKETTPREMKDQIIKLLDDWKGQQKEHEKPEKKNEQEK